MKFGIIILLILGVVAAGSAAMLVGIFNVKRTQTQKTSDFVEVAKAKVAIPAMTVVTASHIVTEKIAKENLPQGKVLSPSQVIGRILATPVVEGQVLTSASFITDGTGAQLIASIPSGMRAVSVTLPAKSVPDDFLLEPGCLVDVLVSFRLPSSSMGSALSTTLLREIQVIAVDGETVVSKANVEGQVQAKTKRAGGQSTVTLLVDTKQAEALQLAMNDGNILLTVRNPLDKRAVDTEATVLSQGRMAGLAEALSTAVLSKVDEEKSIELIKDAINSKYDPNDPNRPTEQNTPGAQTQVAQEKPSIFSLLTQAFLKQNSPDQNASQNNYSNFDAQRNNIEESNSNREPQFFSDGNYNKDQQNKNNQNPRWGVTVIRGSQTTLQQLDIKQPNQ